LGSELPDAVSAHREIGDTEKNIAPNPGIPRSPMDPSLQATRRVLSNAVDSSRPRVFPSQPSEGDHHSIVEVLSKLERSASGRPIN